MEYLWEIRLFGGLAVMGPKRRITRFRTRKSAALLGCLALRLSPQPRETLIDVLWPDAEPEAGRHNLSNALSSLRHVLEPFGVVSGSVVEADRYNVSLNAEKVSVDAIEFEGSLEGLMARKLPGRELIPQFERTLELYRGSLLPGFYEDWISLESLRFDSLFGQGVSRLCDLCIDEREFEKAVHWAHRLWKSGPSDEAALKTLMRALDAAGRPAEALRLYHRVSQAGNGGLAQELSPRTAAMARAIQLRAEQSDAGLTVTNEQVSEPVMIEEALTEAGGAAVETSNPNGLEVADRVEPEKRSKLVGDEFLIRTFTRFFGRTAEISQLARMLTVPRTRLITITGPGGVGKTRFVLEAIAQATESTFVEVRPFTAFFVPLADISEPKKISDRILKALGGTLQEGESSANAVAAVLAEYERPLLILDNFEQLGGEGALQVRNLLLKSGNVRVLVTSRQRLRLDGEHVFTLNPLPIPGDIELPSEALENPGVGLFFDRAEAVRQDFEASPKNVELVTRICGLLEGVPLSIELAAARVAIMSPARILTGVTSNVLDFLGEDSNDRVSRQRTIRSTLEWSFELLAPEAKTLLGALSIFRGGWTIEAAQAVYGGESQEVLRLLTELRDSSLVTVVDTDEGIRFTMLEVIRESATEDLRKSGSSEYERRHASYFSRLAEGVVPGFLSPEGLGNLRRFSLEQSNIAVARGWADDHPSDGINQELGIALIRYWLSVSSEHIMRRLRIQNTAGESTLGLFIPLGGPMDFAEDPERLSKDLERITTLFEERGITEAAAFNLVQSGYANLGRNLHVARDFADRGVALMRQVQNDTALAHALDTVALITCLQGEYDRARELNREARSFLREDRESRTYDFTVHVEGIIAFMSGDHALGERSLKQNIEFARKSADTRSEYAGLYILIRLYNEQLRYLESLSLFDRARGILAEPRSRTTFLSGYLSCFIGRTHFKLGRTSEALAALRNSLLVFGQSKETQGFAMTLVVLAEIALSDCRYELAAKLYGASEMFREKHGRALDYQETIWDEAIRSALREGLGADFEEEVGSGRLLTEQDATALGFWAIELLRGEIDRSAG